MSDPRLDFAYIALAYGSCDEVLVTMESPTLLDVWYNSSADHEQWVLEHFLPPREVLRVRRMVASVRELVLDSARLAYQETGQAVPVNEAFVRELQRRVLHCLEPSLYEIAAQAQGAPAARMAKELIARIPEDKWQGV